MKSIYILALLMHLLFLIQKGIERMQIMMEDDNFLPKPEKSDKSFFEKVKDMFA